jgi:hypothetical protein
MRLIDKRPKVSRRTLLKTGAAVAAVVPAIGAAQAAPMAVSPESFATLVKMARDIYPHDKLSDMYYAKVIEGHDAAAKDDAAKKTMLEDGVAALNAAAGGSYAGLADEAARVAALKGMESTPFFQAVRGSLVTGLYNNPEVWPIFGYEGSSADKGGYIARGFDDIDWLDKA